MSNDVMTIEQIRQQVDHVLQERQDEIRRGVQEALAAIFQLVPEQINPNAELEADLSAESIDVLDLIYKLERRFGVRIPNGQVRRTLQQELGPALEAGGRLTPIATERLGMLMPEISPQRIQSGLAVEDIPGLFTVESFVRLVAWQLSLR